MSFTSVPRFTRSSQKAIGTTVKASRSCVNTSYETIIHKEVRKSDTEPVSMELILADLRNKLASSHALNAELQLEISNLKRDLRDKNKSDVFMTLDGKLDLLLSARCPATIEASTQTALSVVCDASTQVEIDTITDLDRLSNSCQTPIDVQHLGYDTDADLHGVSIFDVGEIVGHEINDNHISLINVETSPKNVTVRGATLHTNVNQQDLTTFDSCEILGDRINDNHISLINDKASPKRAMLYTDHNVLLVRTKIHLVTDEAGRDLASMIQDKLPAHYTVTATVKSGDTLENITRFVKNSSLSLTKSDHVIVLVNSRHACDNPLKYMKRQMSRLISGLNHTNLLMATIPYRFDNINSNEFIHEINQYIENIVSKYNDKMCLYTNKILSKTDFNKRNLIGSAGLKKLAGVVRDYVNYVVNGRCLDRCAEKVTDSLSTECEVEPERGHLSFKPSSRGTTNSTTQNKKKNRTTKNWPSVPKNQRPIRRNKLLSMLKELLSIIN